MVINKLTQINALAKCMNEAQNKNPYPHDFVECQEFVNHSEVFADFSVTKPSCDTPENNKNYKIAIEVNENGSASGKCNIPRYIWIKNC